MLKQLIIISFLINGIPALADLSTYTIDEKFEATFPSKPSLLGELGSGKYEYRSYQHVDQDNLIVYSATYQVGTSFYRPKDIPVALNYYAKGQAIAVGGELISCTHKHVGENHSIIFFVKFKFQNVLARKYGIAFYKEGHIYQWTVQDCPSMSTLNAKTIFDKYANTFSIK